MRDIVILLMICTLFLFTQCDDEPTNTETATVQETLEQEEPQEQAQQPLEIPETFSPYQVLPTNDAKGVPSLKAFIDSLRVIAAAKDVEALSAALSDNVTFGVEGKKGKTAFLEEWNLADEAETSAVWEGIEAIVNGGGSFSNASRTRYTAPRWATYFPKEYNKDIFGVIKARNVNIRSRANRKSKQVARLSYDLVIPIEEDDPVCETIGRDFNCWYRIRMPDGEEGYVFGKFLKTNLKEKAVFQQVMGKEWQIGVLEL